MDSICFRVLLISFVSSGQPCVFPFKTGEGLKYNCTIVGDLDFEFWCATQTDDDHNMYEWGHCSPGCHKPQDMQDTG